MARLSSSPQLTFSMTACNHKFSSILIIIIEQDEAYIRVVIDAL
jgi:hypothetical protein